MKHIAKSLLAVTITGLLFGCGGGDNSSDTPVDSSVQLKVRAIDGVLKGALVWVDLNSNGSRDSAEPSATSDGEGRVAFTLEKGQEHSPVYVEAIAGETEDLERGLIEQGFTLVAPADGDTDRVVSPLTTLLFLEIASGSDPDQAREALAERLGLEPAMLEADFIELKDGRAAFIAKVVTDALPAELPKTQADQKGLLTALNESSNEAAAIYGKLKDESLSEAGDPTLKSEIDYNTREALFTIEYATRKSEGDKVLSEGTKYYWDRIANDYERLNGKPLIATVWSLEERTKSDGTVERYTKWEHDFNRDGTRDFKGQSYAEVKGDQWREFYDEDTNCREMPTECHDQTRRYDGEDLRAALAAADYSTIDFVQDWKRTKSQDRIDVEMQEYKSDAPTRDWFNPDNPGKPLYRRLEHHVTGEEGRSITYEDDWDADGSINQWNTLLTRLNGSSRYSSGKIIWAAPLNGEFEEYADYSYGSDERVSYWYETQQDTTPLGKGMKQERYSGQRFILDDTKNVKLTDSEHPDGYLFNRYQVDQEDISADEQHIYVSWDHLALAGYAFTRDDPGQEFKIMYRHKGAGDAMVGWWLGHSYAEWGSREVSDLPAKVKGLLAEGKSLAQITEQTLPGLDSYNQTVLGGPLFDKGSKRFMVTDNDWFGVSGKQKLTISDGMVEGQNIMLQLAGGMANLVALKGDGSDPCNWWSCWQQNIMSLDSIDPVKGIITLRRWSASDPTTTLYLREADADAALAP